MKCIFSQTECILETLNFCTVTVTTSYTEKEPVRNVKGQRHGQDQTKETLRRGGESRQIDIEFTWKEMSWKELQVTYNRLGENVVQRSTVLYVSKHIHKIEKEIFSWWKTLSVSCPGDYDSHTDRGDQRTQTVSQSVFVREFFKNKLSFSFLVVHNIISLRQYHPSIIRTR